MTPEIKTIIVPNYCPLYAMHKCYGPLRAPIGPTPTPVHIIGELLLQSGNEAAEIYEVVPDDATMEPVRLTLDNYDKPYAEISGKVEVPVTPPAADPVVTPVAEPVTPPTVEVKSEETVNETAGETETSNMSDEDAELAKLAEEIAMEDEIKAAAEAAKDNRSAQNGNKPGKK